MCKKNNTNYLQIKKRAVYLQPQLKAVFTTLKSNVKNISWSIRLSVRTPGFHPGKRGSTPLWTTK